MSFKDLLGKQMLFFDGATGTQLQARGLQAGELPERWNFTHPEIIEAVHKDYLAAGANILKTNTFGANPIKLAETDLDCKATITAAVTIAKKACAGAIDKFVALDLGPTGKLLAPYGDLPFEKAVAAYGEMVRYGVEAGADLILIETMSDTYETKAAILGAKENCDLPVCVTLTFDEDGKLLTGATVEAAALMCEGLGVDAIGFNCGLGPVQVAKLVPQMLQATKLPLIVNPNAGLPVQRDGKTCFDINPEEYADLMYALACADAPSIMGGCCGTTPAHIAAMITKCKNLQPGGTRELDLTAVSSYGKAVHIGDVPVIIGERINPTGKKRLKEALKNQELDYVCRLALEQISSTAHILDVNVGTPGIDETAMLGKAVPALQAITDTPLQIDTSNYEAMEKALRLYNGKPMLNSVNGKEDSLEHVLPLAKKYGAVVVALCLDDSGIPTTAEGRIAIADKIIARAAEYGIESRNIVVDPLAMTVSTGADNAAAVACEVIRAMKARGINTVMGVSNISFGLPGRDAVNSTFFAMAMQAGLSCGIINPQSKAMLDAYYGFCALAGYDEGCQEYVKRYADAPKAAPISVSDVNLYDAIVKGLQIDAKKAAAVALADEAPLDVINKYMIPALDFVGDGFEKKTLFLPQLLMSADAAKAAFEVIREAVGVAETQSDTVVIATVHGDIHDIGKNIVKVLLENYGYKVLDLGKDVPVADIVKTVQESGAKVVGLSALMTTTVSAMEATINALREVSDCKIVVGGAVLTEEYAQSIGAEHYAPNAVSAVTYVNEVFGK